MLGERSMQVRHARTLSGVAPQRDAFGVAWLPVRAAQ